MTATEKSKSSLIKTISHNYHMILQINYNKTCVTTLINVNNKWKYIYQLNP
jgi:hypothetical protein